MEPDLSSHCHTQITKIWASHLNSLSLSFLIGEREWLYLTQRIHDEY